MGLALLTACAFKLTEVERAELPVCSGPFADECDKCRAGVTSACGRLADRYEQGYGVRVDDRAAGLLRAHACELGDTGACFSTAEAVGAGLRLEHAGIAATDRVTICQRAKIGCGVGSGELCTVVARCAQRKHKDDAEAQALLVRTCAKGYAPACYYAAFRAPGDDGTTEMHRRGCALGYAPACVEYAYMQSIGRGVPADPAAGLETYKKSCADTGSFYACAGARGYRPLARMKGIAGVPAAGDQAAREGDARHSDDHPGRVPRRERARELGRAAAAGVDAGGRRDGRERVERAELRRRRGDGAPLLVLADQSDAPVIGPAS